MRGILLDIVVSHYYVGLLTRVRESPLRALEDDTLLVC